VRTVLERHERAHGERVHATSFVIASPERAGRSRSARMLGHQWIGEHWWAAAVASGRFDIGNHGWDHVSPSVTTAGAHEGKAGSFRHVDTFEEADLQVRVAREYIAAKAPNPATGFFAYPYGDESAYAADDYLPRHVDRHGTIAAFTGRPGPVHPGSDRWRRRATRAARGLALARPASLARIVRD
jgi:peptidoglycan/xylan/chitin deacetylase (PgdA/CDA1 family)